MIFPRKPHTKKLNIHFHRRQIRILWLTLTFVRSESFLKAAGFDSTGGMVRWLKQSLNKTCLTWSHMHEKSRWLKVSITCLFTEMAHFFDDWNLRDFEIESSRFLMHMTSRETCLLRWLFESSHHTPVHSRQFARTFSNKIARSLTLWVVLTWRLPKFDLFFGRSSFSACVTCSLFHVAVVLVVTWKYKNQKKENDLLIDLDSFRLLF